MKKIILVASIVALGGCVSISFSDGSNGICELSNKRGIWSLPMHGVASIRRSDDPFIAAKPQTSEKLLAQYLAL